MDFFYKGPQITLTLIFVLYQMALHSTEERPLMRLWHHESVWTCLDSPKFCIGVLGIYLDNL